MSDEHYLKRELYQQVQKSADLFEFIQAGSLDGIWYWDLENPEHEWMSPRFWQIFGYDPTAMPHLASAWQDMINTDDLAMALENFQAHCDNPNHPYDQVVRYRHKEGKTIWVRCRGIAIRDAEGKPIRMLGAHTDITELKEAEYALQQKTDELTLSNQQLEQLAYITAHDLQEPIRGIVTFLDLLARESQSNLNETAQNYLQLAMGEAGLMRAMVHDILALAQVNADSSLAEKVDLERLIKTVEQDLKNHSSFKAYTIERDKLPVIRGHSKILLLLLKNLINNGLKFNLSDQPQVRIDAEKTEGGWKISVSDNGIGIEEKYADRIFKMFQRLHSRSQFPGTGIGLAIAQAVVTRHGGELQFTSELGVGTTFFFTIPNE